MLATKTMAWTTAQYTNIWPMGLSVSIRDFPLRPLQELDKQTQAYMIPQRAQDLLMQLPCGLLLTTSYGSCIFGVLRHEHWGCSSDGRAHDWQS
jgi:hypothetical protein